MTIWRQHRLSEDPPAPRFPCHQANFSKATSILTGRPESVGYSLASLSCQFAVATALIASFMPARCESGLKKS